MPPLVPSQKASLKAPDLTAAGLELRVACRRLAARPLTSFAAFFSLALGLALVSLVLSVADRLLLRPLPVIDEADELFVLQRRSLEGKPGDGSLSWLDLETLRSEPALRNVSGPAISGPAISGHYATHLGLSFDAEPGASAELGTRRIEALVHSDGYGEVLGVSPRLGRWPRDLPGGGLEVALSHELWLELDGQAGILGRTLRLQGQAVEVVGVLPPGFVGTDHVHRPQVFVPISTFERVATGIDGQWVAKRDGKTWLTVVARTSAAGLDGVLDRLSHQFAEARPEVWQGRHLEAVSLLHRAFGGEHRRQEIERHLGLLLMALGCAFLVAYANAAGLVAVRAVDRLDEWRLRSALGAGRRRLVATASLEGLVLGLGSLAAAPLFQILLLPLIRRLRLPEGALVDVAAGPRQLLPMLALGALGALPLSATPSLTLAAGQKLHTIRSRASSAPVARQLFVAAQIALAFVALRVAFQLVRTVEAYRQVDPGVSADATDRLLAVGLDVGAAGHEGAEALDAFRQIDDTLRALAGVESATLAATLPILDSGPMVNLTIQAEGADPPVDGEHHTALHALVGSRYFTTVGRQVLEGRDFQPGDDGESPPVLVVDRTLAERLWSGRSALGRQIRLVAANEPYTVVGVVEDGRYASLTEESRPTLFMAHAQSGHSMIATSIATSATVLVRPRSAPSASLLRDVRAAVAHVDPAVPVLSIRPLRDLIEEHFALERQLASILVAVAGALLLFCLLGVYGGLAHSLVHQRRELAVRSALGAGRRHLLARLATSTGRSLALGLLLGLWLVPMASGLLEGVLFGVEAQSSRSWMVAGGVLLGAILLAGFGPVRAAMTLETAALLRED